VYSHKVDSWLHIMGVDHGGQGRQVPPEFGAGDANANCNLPPPRFCQVQKWAFCGLYNTPKSVFGRGSVPDPSGGAHDASPDTLVGWRGDSPPHTPPHSARTYLRRSPCVPPEVQPDLYAYAPHPRLPRCSNKTISTPMQCSGCNQTDSENGGAVL